MAIRTTEQAIAYELVIELLAYGPASLLLQNADRIQASVRFSRTMVSGSWSWPTLC